ncbi:MAG: glutathione S-transferase N-terminal domain-containing protein [Rhizobiaceae bacterium]|nr:glutathione S-transferase N-terminal domain-containing protein [Rhizobiaceae bacterium]
MRLYTGPTTPFGRMVEVLAIEAGITLEREVVAVTDAAFLDDLNPLRLIPTLLASDGTAIFDSRVICRYLAALRPELGLYPPRDDWAFETRLALITGIMDAGVARQGERLRPEGMRSEQAIAVLERQILNGIARLEQDAGEICAGPPRMDRIAAAVLLAYTDFRFTRDWRETAPRLSEWMETQVLLPSMLQTAFVAR